MTEPTAETVEYVTGDPDADLLLHAIRQLEKQSKNHTTPLAPALQELNLQFVSGLWMPVPEPHPAQDLLDPEFPDENGRALLVLKGLASDATTTLMQAYSSPEDLVDIVPYADMPDGRIGAVLVHDATTSDGSHVREAIAADRAGRTVTITRDDTDNPLWFISTGGESFGVPVTLSDPQLLGAVVAVAQAHAHGIPVPA